MGTIKELSEENASQSSIRLSKPSDALGSSLGSRRPNVRFCNLYCISLLTLYLFLNLEAPSLFEEARKLSSNPEED